MKSLPDSGWRSLLRPSSRHLADFLQHQAAAFRSGLNGTLEGSAKPQLSMSGLPIPNGPGTSKDTTRTSFASTGVHMTTGLARPRMPPPAVVGGAGWPFSPHGTPPNRLFSRGIHGAPGSVYDGMSSPATIPHMASTHSASHSVASSLRTSPQHLLAPYIYPHLPHASHPGVSSFPYHSAYASLMQRSPFGLGHSELLATTSRGQRPPGLQAGSPPTTSLRHGAINDRNYSEETLSKRLPQNLRSPSTPSGYLPHMYFNRGEQASRAMPAPRRFPCPPEHRGSHPISSRLSLSKHGNETMPYYPCHFMKGTRIQLGNDEFKCVEDLCTEDFVKSANLCSDLRMNSSTVVRIEPKSSDIVILSFSVGEEKAQVSVEATIEHPFFVMGQGWSSCSPERSSSLYRLTCKKLQVGDVCMSLTHVDSAAKAAIKRKRTESQTNSDTPTPSKAARAAHSRPERREVDASGRNTDDKAHGPASLPQPPPKAGNGEPFPKKRRWSFT